MLTRSILFLSFILGGMSQSTAAPGDLLFTIPNPNLNPRGSDYFGRWTASLGDSFLVSSASDDQDGVMNAGSVYQFNSRTGALIRRVPNPFPPVEPDDYIAFGVAIAGLQDTFVVANRSDAPDRIGSLYQFDGATGQLLRQLIEPAGLKFERNIIGCGDSIIVGASNVVERRFDVAVFDQASGEFRFSLVPAGDDTEIGQLFASRNGKLLVDGDSEVLEFDATTGQLTARFPLTSHDIETLLVNSAGDIIVGYHSGAAEVYDGDSHEFVRHLTLVNGDVFGTAGGALAVAQVFANEYGGRVLLYDDVTGEHLLTLDNPTGRESEYFGASLTAVGGHLLIGAFRADIMTDPAKDAGAVYVFEGFPSPPQPGDTDADVDLEDLNNVRNNFGASGLGDTNADGLVDLEDLNNVRNHFGETASAAASVPEPATAALGFFMVLAVAACARRCVPCVLPRQSA